MFYFPISGLLDAVRRLHTDTIDRIAQRLRHKTRQELVRERQTKLWHFAAWAFLFGGALNICVLTCCLLFHFMGLYSVLDEPNKQNLATPFLDFLLYRSLGVFITFLFAAAFAIESFLCYRAIQAYNQIIDQLPLPWNKASYGPFASTSSATPAPTVAQAPPTPPLPPIDAIELDTLPTDPYR